jgi:cell filamentation protein
MYRAVEDPHCYPNSTVLKNLPGLRTARALAAFETRAVANRAEEEFPSGRLGVRHYRAVHRHLFQDVYAWAGRLRMVRVSRGASAFCYPEYIAAELRALFGTLHDKAYLRNLPPAEFSREAASFLAGLNAIRAFRDGNGRTQMAFMGLLAFKAGHYLAFERLDPDRHLDAMIRSFRGDEAPLAAELLDLLGVD